MADGTNPLLVNFMETVQGNPQTFRWDFDNDGIFDISGPGAGTPSFTFPSPGTYPVTLEVDVLCGGLAATTVSTTINVTVGPNIICQDLNLVSGTNFLSLTVDPIDNSLTNIFGPVSGVSLVTTYRNGSATPWIPGAGPFNRLQTFDRGFGYLVNYSGAPTTVQICGTVVNGTVRNPLSGELNTIGSDLDTTIAISDYYATEIANGSIEVVSPSVLTTPRGASLFRVREDSIA